ncbi:MAG: PHP domain-containing protein [Synergistaceae bacterium]|jgi:predicted metal-dependent phosphoesterase TrpH|nr:PHP domain-containing protein [Synergistaceae bacterium]
MIRIDMHVHSSFSDGTCSVDEIAKQAAARGIVILALTDHDNLDGQKSFASACKKYSIKHLPGVELSSKCPFTAHILGYRLTKTQPLEEALEWVVKRRNERNSLILERLNSQGVKINIEDIEFEAGGRVIARPHFASALVKKGYVPDITSAFSKYLAKGAAAYVSREAYSPEDCVRLIREAGGLPVLAHPSLTGLDNKGLGDFLDELTEYGLWGLECISSHCKADEALGFLKIASEHNLFPTAGSDFHGARRPGITLGVQVTESFLPWARLGVAL